MTSQPRGVRIHEHSEIDRNFVPASHKNSLCEEICNITAHIKGNSNRLEGQKFKNQLVGAGLLEVPQPFLMVVFSCNDLPLMAILIKTWSVQLRAGAGHLSGDSGVHGVQQIPDGGPARCEQVVESLVRNRAGAHPTLTV